MEYEISEEGELLDRSNNPSLDHHHDNKHSRQLSIPAALKPHRMPLVQRAEFIPEKSDGA